MRRQFGASGLLVAWALAVTAAAVASMTPTTQTKTTKTYVFKLTVGVSEQMWTPAQVKAKHPTSGEVMLMGSMTSSGMPMGGSQRHLEVHITSRPSGKVVVGAHPAITTLDTTVKHGMMSTVPVAVMEGVGEGIADLHYGNNVDLIAGHVYTITVTLHGQRASFQIKSPS
jgi:hypothetical protein